MYGDDTTAGVGRDRCVPLSLSHLVFGMRELMSIDPYKPDDPSPLTSDAISSSCWELQSLQSHYLASVSTLAKVFNEVFTKSEYSLEDFLDHGYGTVCPLLPLALPFLLHLHQQIRRSGSGKEWS